MSLYPLPLTAYEHYMLADDREGYPSVIRMGLSFDRHLEPDYLKKAIEFVVSRHALLRSRVEGSITCKSSHLVWQPCLKPPDITWRKIQDSEISINNCSLELQDSNGVQFIVENYDHGSKLWVQVHHSCCDGIGLNQLCSDLLNAYDHMSGSNRYPLESEYIEESLLKFRDKFDRSCREWALLPFVYPWQIAQFNFRRFEPIALPENKTIKPQSRQDAIVFQSGMLQSEYMTGLKRRCHILNVTLNDMLLQKWFLTLNSWNIKHCPDRNLPIRILMPVDMRGLSKSFRDSARRGSQFPICPMVGYVFIHPQTESLKRPSKLLHEIQQFTYNAKKMGYKYIFLDALKMMRNHIYYNVNSDKCYASSVLSNFGTLFASSQYVTQKGDLTFGGVQLTKVEAMAPIRPLTHASCTALTYAGKLAVNVLVDSAWLRKKDADCLLSMFLTSLKTEAMR